MLILIAMFLKFKYFMLDVFLEDLLLVVLFWAKKISGNCFGNIYVGKAPAFIL